MSWFDYAKIIFRAAGLSPELRPTNEREYRTSREGRSIRPGPTPRWRAAERGPIPPLEDAVRMCLDAREEFFAQ
jgi:dTDP-4-dehydrorhamnose reductase